MKKELLKPRSLKSGDTVATVSLSWGGAGDPEFLWRYQQGRERLEKDFGLKVIEMEHTLKGSDYLYEHPEKRAEDLMEAFRNREIKGIFSCIGGSESIRLLPYIDFEVIKKNPKIFIGYSDTTIGHLICLKAGLSSFYGPSILAEFAENVRMFPYTVDQVRRALFSTEPMGLIPEAEGWTSEHLPWLLENKEKSRALLPYEGIQVLQGRGKVSGRLMGGCIEVLEMAKGTSLWPEMEVWEDAILFFETSEDKPLPEYFEYWLRNYGSQGILQKAKGLIFGKPYDNCYYEDYKEIIKKIVVGELGLRELPIFLNMNFGHTAPMMTLPYGALAELDSEGKTFSIMEAGVRK